MLWVGQQERHPAFKNWVMSYWHGYLSGARYQWFAYGPADATATPSSLAPVKSGMVYLSGAGLPRLSWKKGRYTDVVKNRIAFMLQAQFLSTMPDVQLLHDTVEYVNLSFNSFKVKRIINNVHLV